MKIVLGKIKNFRIFLTYFIIIVSIKDNNERPET